LSTVTPRRENAERPETLLDAVQRRPHVEATDRRIARRQPIERLERRDDLQRGIREPNRGEREGGRARRAGDKPDPHGRH